MIKRSYWRDSGCVKGGRNSFEKVILIGSLLVEIVTVVVCGSGRVF